MSDHGGVQVSDQRDAGKCSAALRVTVTYVLSHTFHHVTLFSGVHIRFQSGSHESTWRFRLTLILHIV